MVRYRNTKDRPLTWPWVLDFHGRSLIRTWTYLKYKKIFLEFFGFIIIIVCTWVWFCVRRGHRQSPRPALDRRLNPPVEGTRVRQEAPTGLPDPCCRWEPKRCRVHGPSATPLARHVLAHRARWPLPRTSRRRLMTKGHFTIHCLIFWFKLMVLIFASYHIKVSRQCLRGSKILFIKRGKALNTV